MTWLGLPGSLTPGRRPRTTLTPSIALREGVPVMAFGTPGGDREEEVQLPLVLLVAARGAERHDGHALAQGDRGRQGGARGGGRG
ncbi:hypothetical protein SPURM210S_05643 [Streptomyces purpurascens]